MSFNTPNAPNTPNTPNTPIPSSWFDCLKPALSNFDLGHDEGAGFSLRQGFCDRIATITNCGDDGVVGASGVGGEVI